MEEKRKVIRHYVSQGLKLSIALEVINLPRSTYYYKTNGKRVGKQATTRTLKSGEWVQDEQVVKEIKKILEPDFIDYGYRRTTAVLQERGYAIGKKKVYRLMKQNHLLQKPIRGKHPGNMYRDYKSPQPDGPYVIIELDFKYIWIEGQKRHAYLLSMLDTFHRQVYEWSLDFEMKAEQVKELIIKFVNNHLIAKGIDPSRIKITMRTDNGCQFTSILYREILDDLKIKYQYIPVGVPQLNGHIEGFHSTIQRLVCKHFEFLNIDQARKVFNRFYVTYNTQRIMKSILNKRPVEFLQLWEKGRIGYIKKNGKNKFFFKEEGHKKPSLLELDIVN